MELCSSIFRTNIFKDGDHHGGYSLERDYSGNGYCLEAVSGLCDYLRVRHVSSVKAEVDKGNIASVRVLQNAGFVFQKDTEGYLIYKKCLEEGVTKS